MTTKTLPAGPKLKTTIPGPNAKRVLAGDHKYISPSYTRSYPLVAKRGRGIVIEDVDLIARERTHMHGPGEEVLLNKLLNEMDGLREDAIDYAKEESERLQRDYADLAGTVFELKEKSEGITEIKDPDNGEELLVLRESDVLAKVA